MTVANNKLPLCGKFPQICGRITLCKRLWESLITLQNVIYRDYFDTYLKILDLEFEKQLGNVKQVMGMLKNIVYCTSY